MREEKGEKAASGAPGYPWEDRAMKAAAQFMGQELLPLLGVNTPIKRVAPTEQVYLKTEMFSEDFNYELVNGGLLHLEFESDSITKEDLRRFRVYESLLSYQYGTEVTTCVICTSQAKFLRSELKDGINLYRVQTVRLKNWDADEIIASLEEKQQSEILTREDLLKLILTPLMGGNMPQSDRIRRSFHLLREERRSRECRDLLQMQAVLYAFSEKFLDAEELQKVKEEIHMTRLGQMIFEDGVQEGQRLGLEQGRELGLEQGQELVNRLISRLLEEGRMDDIGRAVRDQEYQKQLFTELGIL